MVKQIPLNNNESFYSFQVDLDGQIYRIDQTWNERAQSWFFDMYDAEENIIIAGRRFFAGNELLGSFINSLDDVPQNVLILGFGESKTDPGRNDLGEKNKLWYYGD